MLVSLAFILFVKILMFVYFIGLRPRITFLSAPMLAYLHRSGNFKLKYMYLKHCKLQKQREEVLSHQPEIDRFTDDAQNLMHTSSDARLSTQVSNLTNRYRGLLSLIKVQQQELVNRTTLSQVLYCHTTIYSVCMCVLFSVKGLRANMSLKAS